jgi:glycosyltransferase involved in cell wall biosynthesis
MKISASIIVRNEEENLPRLCQSIDWVDEIVIVDSDSTDRTIEVARRFTSAVFNHPFRGYRDKHEFADAQTTGDWIFWLDADEEVTPPLRKAIEALRERDPATLPDGFRIARRTLYQGRWIAHSGWYPDYQMRFYRKDTSYWDGVAPHETARVRGRIETLPGELLHFTKRNLSEHHHVLDSYTSLAANYLHRQGRRTRPLDLFLLPIAAFFRTYLLKQGFRDGVPGLIIAMFSAYSVFLKYAKLWEANRLEQSTGDESPVTPSPRDSRP